MLALCNYSEGTDGDGLLAIRTALTMFSCASIWVVNPNVDSWEIVMKLTHSMLTGCCKFANEEAQVKLMRSIMSIILHWTTTMDSTEHSDPNYIRLCIHATMEGIRTALPSLTDAQKCVILEQSIAFLDGSAFDVRLVLVDAPPDFRLEDVVKEHFAPTLILLNILGQIVIGDDPMSLLARLRNITTSTFQSLSAYLITSVSSEPFLCSIAASLLVIGVLFSLDDLM